MKNYFLIFILFAFTLGCFAQNPEKSNKNVYQVDQKLYINKELGVYLWLSTSPDPNSEKFRLLSDSSKQYSNPMYFDTEGINTIRHKSAVDTNSKRLVNPIQDVVFEVYVDGLSPVTKADVITSMSKLIEGKIYYGGNTSIKLKSSDEISGVAGIFYSLNGESFKEYTEPVSSFKEDENVFKFYATDKTGNQENIQTKNFVLDNTPPKTEYEIVGLLSNNFVAPDASIKLKSTDGLSGVKAVYYKIGKGNYNRYINPIPVSLIKNENDQISFYAEDNLGNVEKAVFIGGKGGNLQIQGASENIVFEFYVDKEPPEVKVEIEGDQYNGKNKYISKRTQIKVTAEDEKSGVDKIVYGWNQSPVDKVYQSPVNAENNGLCALKVKSMDFVGNVSSIITNQFVCDDNPPASSISVGSPKFKSRDTLFISSKTPVIIASADDLSGVNTISYKVGNNTEMKYAKAFTVEETGFKTISYYTTDKVNNIETVKIQEIFVDNVPPVIHHHFSVEPIGNKDVRDDKYTIYPSNAMLYIATTDANSGAERIEYKINKGQTMTANPITGLKPGNNYFIEVTAYDVLGNKSTTEIKFSIEE